MNTATVI